MFSKLSLIFLYVFSVVPWYDFKEDELAHPEMFKIYSALLVCSLASLSCVLFYFRYQLMLAESHVIIIIVETLTELGNLILCVLTVLRSSFGAMHAWRELFRKIKLMTAAVDVTTDNLNILFLLGLISFMAIVSIEITVNAVFIPYYISYCVYHSYYLLNSFTILSLSVLLLRGCRNINGLFRWESSNSDTINSIKRIKNMYLDMNDLTEYICEVIGWPFLSLSFCCMANMLDIFVFIVRDNVLWGNISYVVTKKMVLLNVEHLLIFLVSVNVHYLIV